MAYKWLISSLVITCFCFFFCTVHGMCWMHIYPEANLAQRPMVHQHERTEDTRLCLKIPIDVHNVSIFILFSDCSFGFETPVYLYIYIYVYYISCVFLDFATSWFFKTPLGDASQASAPAPARSGRRRSPRTFFPRVPSKNACCVVFLTGA